MNDIRPIRNFITIACFEDGDFTVAMNDRSCDRLAWDEMLGQVAQLTAPNPPRLYPMLTDDEHAEAKRKRDERLACRNSS